MSSRPCVKTEDRFASLIALGALGLLSEPISDGVRIHLRPCDACRMQWRDLRSRSDMFELRTVRAGRSTDPQMRQDAQSISDCPFVECAPGERWAVTSDNGVTLVYRIVNPLANPDTRNVRNGSGKFGIVLEGGLTITYAEQTSQRLGVWDTYTVPADVVHVEEFHERTLVFEVYVPKNVDYEEQYDRQIKRRRSTAPAS